jgi:general secretion pathway protein C
VLLAQWLNSSGEMTGRMSAVLAGVVQTLSQPQNARRLRLLVLAVLSIWAVLALASLVWALVPSTDTPESAPPVAINPVSSSGAGESAQPVNINQIVEWHLFGEAGADRAPAPKPEVAAPTQALDGIEKGARQTRLKLSLRGIVASTESGLGHAIIEYQRKQDVYAVEDKLPLPGKVTLAKVMPTQVVINNAGTYELLKLFDKSSLVGPVAAPARKPPPKPAAAKAVDKRSDLDVSQLASTYRARLYEDPQSLAKVVGVSAVRKDGALVGYRVMPGQDRDQFTQLGFKSGDVVKSVNGIDLSSPGNTMRLYNIMRSAGEAVFEVERGGDSVTLSVNLAE